MRERSARERHARGDGEACRESPAARSQSHESSTPFFFALAAGADADAVAAGGFAATLLGALFATAPAVRADPVAAVAPAPLGAFAPTSPFAFSSGAAGDDDAEGAVVSAEADAATLGTGDGSTELEVSDEGAGVVAMMPVPLFRGIRRIASTLPPASSITTSGAATNTKSGRRAERVGVASHVDAVLRGSLGALGIS